MSNATEWSVTTMPWATDDNLEALTEMLADLDFAQDGLDHAVPFQKRREKAVNALIDFYRNTVADDYYGGP